MGRFRQAAQLMPSSTAAHLWLARAALRAGLYQDARIALDRVIAIAPASEAAREARALLETIK
jgi:Tfp pilus assembly protein PilF